MLMTQEVRQGFINRAVHHEQLAAKAIAADQRSFVQYHRDLAVEYRKAAAEPIETPAPAKVEAPPVVVPVDVSRPASFLHGLAFWMLAVFSIFYWTWVYFNKVHI